MFELSVVVYTCTRINHKMLFCEKYSLKKQLSTIRGVFQSYAEKSHNFTSAALILLKFMDIIP